jgi:hypothetical protein
MAKRLLYSHAPLHYSAIRQLASDWHKGEVGRHPTGCPNVHFFVQQLWSRCGYAKIILVNLIYQTMQVINCVVQCFYKAKIQ